MNQYSGRCHRTVMRWFINVNQLFCSSLHCHKIVHGYQCCFNIQVRKYVFELFHNDIVIVTQYTGQCFHVYYKGIYIVLSHVKLKFIPGVLLLASGVTPRIEPFKK